MNMRASIVVFALSSMIGLGAGQATQLAGASPAGANVSPASIDPATRAAMRDDSNSLLSGVIDSVDVATGSIVIQGRALHFDASSAQVFSAKGGTLSPYALRANQSVRFLRDGNDPSKRTIRVFYLP